MIAQVMTQTSPELPLPDFPRPLYIRRERQIFKRMNETMGNNELNRVYNFRFVELMAQELKEFDIRKQ
jgi:hypothetical protein